MKEFLIHWFESLNYSQDLFYKPLDLCCFHVFIYSSGVKADYLEVV